MAESSERTDLERGIELAQQGQKEAAYASLRRALFSDGDSPELRLWLAQVAATPGESLQHLERAQELEPDNAEVAAALEQARPQPGAEPPPHGWSVEAALPAAPGAGVSRRRGRAAALRGLRGGAAARRRAGRPGPAGAGGGATGRRGARLRAAPAGDGRAGPPADAAAAARHGRAAAALR